MRNKAIMLTALWLCSFLSFVGCTQEQKAVESDSPAILPITFVSENFLKQSPNCKSDSVSCATVHARYLLVSGGTDSVRQKINNTLMHFLKGSMAVYAVEEKEYRIPLEQVAERFIADYQSLRKDNPAYDIPWEVETEGTVLFHSSKLVSFQYSTYSNTGGAHPNSFLTLLVMDKNSGNKLELSDFITDMPNLKTIAEQYFRNTHGLSATQSLDDAGFFWGQSFVLPENYALTDSGLYFYYNNYEIAPYVVGPTEFTIPYADLEGIIIKNKIF